VLVLVVVFPKIEHGVQALLDALGLLLEDVVEDGLDVAGEQDASNVSAALATRSQLLQSLKEAIFLLGSSGAEAKRDMKLFTLEARSTALGIFCVTKIRLVGHMIFCVTKILLLRLYGSRFGQKAENESA